METIRDNKEVVFVTQCERGLTFPETHLKVTWFLHSVNKP